MGHLYHAFACECIFLLEIRVDKIWQRKCLLGRSMNRMWLYPEASAPFENDVGTFKGCDNYSIDLKSIRRPLSMKVECFQAQFRQKDDYQR